MKNYTYIAPTGDGWRNLAIDEYLLNSLRPGELCLLLYRNDNAVILGRNQNPWIECNLEKMRSDGVQLVRRSSGGGAVFHDKGNLNFSFIAHKARYDEERQTALVLRTLERRFGIHAAASGRNDLTANGKKFSGAAFCAREENRQHHGTLLINADMTKLAGYLTVAPQKLEAKGIKSVRARVCNLCELCPDITLEPLAQGILKEFTLEYGTCEEIVLDSAAEAGIEALYQRNRSWAWQLGKAPAFDYTYENRFGYGMARLCVNVREGFIREAVLYTDALDPELPEKASKRLLGLPFEADQIVEILKSL